MGARRNGTTGLTPQQEAFAAGLAAGMSNRAAYVKAYPKAANWKEVSLDPAASRRAADSKVIARIRELQRPIQERYQIDIERMTLQLMEDRAYARMIGNASAAVSATMGLAKLHGLLVEDRKNNKDPFEAWTTEQLLAVKKQAMELIARAKEKGDRDGA
jgi:hypothetical protein